MVNHGMRFSIYIPSAKRLHFATLKMVHRNSGFTHYMIMEWDISPTILVPSGNDCYMTIENGPVEIADLPL